MFDFFFDRNEKFFLSFISDIALMLEKLWTTNWHHFLQFIYFSFDNNDTVTVMRNWDDDRLEKKSNFSKKKFEFKRRTQHWAWKLDSSAFISNKSYSYVSWKCRSHNLYQEVHRFRSIDAFNEWNYDSKFLCSWHTICFASFCLSHFLTENDIMNWILWKV